MKTLNVYKKTKLLYEKYTILVRDKLVVFISYILILNFIYTWGVSIP